MALYILNDASLRVSIPLKSELEISKLRALNRKRITTKLIRSIDSLNVMTDDPEAVLVIQELTLDVEKAIIFCNRYNIPVIVLHSPNTDVPYLNYSSIYGHPYENSRIVIRYCISAQKKQLALFGFNNVAVDNNYAEAVYSLFPTFSQKDYFQTIPDFDECFNRFYERRNDYNSILFANDFIAIRFMEKMELTDPEYIKNRFLIGISDTFISKIYHTTLTSLTYNQNALISAVASIYRILSRNKNQTAGINYLLPPEIFARQSTQSFSVPAYDIVLPHISDIKKPKLKIEPFHYSYEGDAVLSNIMKIENLLSSLDYQGFQLLYYILSGMSNAEISESLHITAQAVQYHTRHMFDKIEVLNKKGFIKQMSHYVSKDNLYEFIRNSIYFSSAPPKNITR